MYIKQLEVDNFKSFANKVEIPMLKGFTTISGPNGSGKSNIVYSILSQCEKLNTKFLVIEPAKGEYKNLFCNKANVYGTNPKKTPLLKIKRAK